MSLSSVSESMFFPRLQGAVFLFWIAQAFLPAAEHFADLLKFFRNVFALRIRNEFSFPHCGDEKFEDICYEDAFRDFFRFLFFGGKIRYICQFQEVEKFVFNPCANSIADAFGNMRRDVHPISGSSATGIRTS